jgi:hypothetical protein
VPRIIGRAGGRRSPGYVVPIRLATHTAGGADANNAMQGHHYNIYPDPDNPSIDAYRHLANWKKWYEGHLMKGAAAIPPSHVIFPQISLATILVSPAAVMSTENVQKMINLFTEGAGLCRSGAHYTTHTFRRGGAQHYFMFCKPGDRMSLGMVRWWGGWADNEKVLYNTYPLNPQPPSHSFPPRMMLSFGTCLIV